VRKYSSSGTSHLKGLGTKDVFGEYYSTWTMSSWANKSLEEKIRTAKREKLLDEIFGAEDGQKDRIEEGDSVFQTGRRVTFRSKYLRGGATGTLVKKVSPDGVWLVCSDIQRAEFGQSSALCGRGHGLFVPEKNMELLLEGNDPGIWDNVPGHIGVVVTQDFHQDGILFHRGTIGRIVSSNPDTSVISWINHSSCGSGQFRNEAGLGNCWTVPTPPLRMCRLAHDHGGNKQAGDVWPAFESAVQFKSGDIVVYRGPKPTTIPGDRRNYGICNGAILRIGAASRRHSAVTVLTGCDEKIIGAEVRVPTEWLVKFEHEFIPTKKKVEIVAEINFRKKSLQGKSGRVVLATDADGDVGVEFDEDIRGGCLDGAGRDGRCLYVSSKALRVVSG